MLRSVVACAGRRLQSAVGLARCGLQQPSPIISRGLATSQLSQAQRRTALYALHEEHQAKMVPFAGYAMPVQYADLGVGPSTIHTRQHASLFDVSHMLQLRLWGKQRTRFLERLVVADLEALPVHASTLSVFTNAKGGIIDDTIINKQPNHYYIVSNAACADKDIAHLGEQLELFRKQHPAGDLKLEIITDQSLLALQGPDAAPILERLTEKDLKSFAFMTSQRLHIGGIPCNVGRSGYTGEDGFEIQVPSSKALELAKLLLEQPNVKWAGLGARDSLRLEAAMCLYGHDLDDSTTPVEAGLTWTIGKRRRVEGGFLGASVIQDQLKNGVQRRRVGFTVEGAPAREGAEIYSLEGKLVGKLTSGGPSPCLKKNIAMGYIQTGFHKAGTAVQVKVRNRMQPAVVTKMPFVETR